MERLEEENQDRERQAKLIRRFLDVATNIAPLKGRRLEEVLADEESTRAFIESLSPTDFVEIITGINGILRGKEMKEWSLDGENVMLSGVFDESYPPRYEDKLALLEEAFEGAQKMNLEGRSIEDIAVLLSASVNEIHPSNDANGRTSRLLYALLIRGYTQETKEALGDILGEYGRENLDVNAVPAHIPIEDLLYKEFGYFDKQTNTFEPQNEHKILHFRYKGGAANLNFAPGVDEELKEEFISFLRRYNNDGCVQVALYKYASSRQDIGSFLEEFPDFNNVDLDKLCPVLTSDDIKQIIENYWQMKKLQVEKFIDVAVHPNKPEYQIERGDFRGNIFEYLKTKITR